MSRYAISTSVSGMGRKQRLYFRTKQKGKHWYKFHEKWQNTSEYNNDNASIADVLYKRSFAEMRAEQKLLRHILLREYWAMLDKES